MTREQYYWYSASAMLCGRAIISIAVLIKMSKIYRYQGNFTILSILELSS